MLRQCHCSFGDNRDFLTHRLNLACNLCNDVGLLAASLPLAGLGGSILELCCEEGKKPGNQIGAFIVHGHTKLQLASQVHTQLFLGSDAVFFGGH